MVLPVYLAGREMSFRGLRNMTDKPDDGGPAFPSPGYDGPTPTGGHLTQYPQPGMTLRQWYAGLAMQGLLACSTTEEDTPGEAAKYAVKFTDALIAELKR